jgi:hypothetical protein
LTGADFAPVSDREVAGECWAELDDAITTRVTNNLGRTSCPMTIFNATRIVTRVFMSNGTEAAYNH